MVGGRLAFYSPVMRRGNLPVPEASSRISPNPQNCYFINGVAQFTVEGNTITGTDKDGATVFSHAYNYKGQDHTFGMDMAVYESADADSGDFLVRAGFA